ncbi:hypothetical protein [Gemmatimonas sp.]|uniref:hypothetical protein n=1 Tax=Gemmatimonas sp. TaxID=1962908 RepID=UPI003341915F
MRRLSFLTILGCATAMCTALPAHAQARERTGGPEKGTWGAEASINGGPAGSGGQGGSLIAFVTPTVALTGGLSFSRTSSRGEFIDESNLLFTPGITTVASNVGVRRYGRNGLGLRPIYGGGVLYTVRSVHGARRDNGVGGYAEAGAAWFFNPHVSLGALGGVSALRTDGSWDVRGSVARLTGAVYF